MKVAILTAILGDFDKPVHPTEQNLPEGVDEIVFHRFTDEDFPPITGLTPRFQYRIPKLFGFDLLDGLGIDIFIWIDGSMSLQHPNSVKWLLEQLGDNDLLVFRHPWRKNISEEADHIEEKLQEGNEYITSRYKNGLHNEMRAEVRKDEKYEDNDLFVSNVFVYRNNKPARTFLTGWWLMQSRYYTCDQLAMTYVAKKFDLKVKIMPQNVFKMEYISLVSKHK